MARIAYLTWPATEVSGGIKAAFQHVEILCAAGFDAWVASESGAAPGWFQSSAPHTRMSELTGDDILVLPENHVELLRRVTNAPNRKLVFCQNPYYAVQGLDDQPSYSRYGVTHVLCPSHSVEAFCRRRLPDLQTAYTPFYIDHERFRCPSSKVLEIACVPRKRVLEAAVIRDMFRATHPQYAHLAWHFVQKANEGQVAAVMSRAAVFLSLQRFEAHGMTALEAMASGCIVAGFDGVFGGNDSSTPQNGFWAGEDDVFGAADQLARAVRLVDEAGPAYQAMAARGCATAAKWRREESARHVVAFWRRFLDE